MFLACKVGRQESRADDVYTIPFQGQITAANAVQEAPSTYMERRYFALNSALLCWLLGLVAWCFEVMHLVGLAAALSITAFILHFQYQQVKLMFKKKNTPLTPASSYDEATTHHEPGKSHEPTVVASGVNVEGNIVADGNVDIYGSLAGNIDAKESQITVKHGGRVEGNIVCRTLIIDGSVAGQCTSDSIEIEENGRVTGTLIYSTLAMKKGAVFCGQAEVMPALSDKPEAPLLKNKRGAKKPGTEAALSTTPSA